MYTYLRRAGDPTVERAESLIEVLVALAIIGIAVVGIFPAVATSLSAADRVRNNARVGEVMSTAVHAVQNASWSTSCDYTSTFTAALATVTMVPKPTITQSLVSQWDGNTFVPGCPTSTNPALQIVRMRVTVTAKGGRGSQWTEVVKRK